MTPSLLDKSIWLAINKKDTLEEEKTKALIELIKNKMSSFNLNRGSYCYFWIYGR